MKRWGILLILGALGIGSTLLLTNSAQKPENFSGKWYHTGDGTPYLFHNGIIISEKYHFSETEDAIFSGAYSFAKDRIVLFFLTENGVERVQELQLVSQRDGDTLCLESDNGTAVIFYRNKTS